MNVNEKYILKQYQFQGLKKCCEELNITYRLGRNILKKLKRNGFLLSLSKSVRSKICRENTLKQDFDNRCHVKAVKFLNPSKESAYIMGLLWADGHLNNKSQRHRIEIEAVWDDLVCLKKLFKGWTIKTRSRINRKKQMTYITCNKVLYHFLKSMDYTDKNYKSADKIISYLKQKNNDLLRFWLLGYLDGDGCVYFNKKRNLRQISFSSGFNQDWNFLSIILNNLNINFKIYKNHLKKSNSKYSCLRFCGKNNCIKFLNYLYPQGFEFGLKRKYCKLQLAVG